MSDLKKTLRDNKWACWFALACLVVPMFASYFFDDMFSSLSELFKNPQSLELGWNMKDYGYYASGYSFLCIWGGLVVCGVLLDKFGVRLVGSIFVGMMVFGAALVTFAISAGFDPGVSLKIAYVGCMLFGLGSEIAGVSVTRSIAKWFKGRNMALAMGLQLAIARFGTATAILIAPMIVRQKPLGEMYTLAETNRPALIGLAVLALGAILWAVFVAMDAKFDRQTGLTDRVETSESDKFRFTDILKVLGNPRFLMIALLCVTFYCCVIRFKKFGVSILLPLFGVDLDVATVLLAMIPFFTILFTPLFGALVDKVGKATLWMIVGSALVLASHLIITFAPQGIPVYAYIAIAMLGIGYSLVPSAMWPSVPKIVPEKNLGTAYSLIYWVQNLGMWAVPIYVGRIFDRYITIPAGADADVLERHAQEVQAAIHAEYVFILLGVVAIAVAVTLYLSARRHPEMNLDTPAS